MIKDVGACTKIWSGSNRKGKVLAPGGRFEQIFEIFEILGGAGDIYNSTSTPKYCDEPFGDLGMYVNKVLSAWTEVSIAT